MTEKYILVINSELTLELPIVKTKHFSYYSFNMMGMAKWNRVIGDEMYQLVQKHPNGKKIDSIITVESKAIGLTQVLAERFNVDKYIILRKSKKSYMANPIEFKSQTIISGECSYWIDSADLDYLKDKNILVVDDVISTGGTIKAILNALNHHHLVPNLIACALTENTPWTTFDGIDVISCGHIPLLPGEQND